MDISYRWILIEIINEILCLIIKVDNKNEVFEIWMTRKILQIFVEEWIW